MGQGTRAAALGRHPAPALPASSGPVQRSVVGESGHARRQAEDVPAISGSPEAQERAAALLAGSGSEARAGRGL